MVNDVHDYNGFNGSGSRDSLLVGMGSRYGGSRGTGLSCTKSAMDLRTGLTSPLSGSSAKLLLNSSEIKAKAEKERRCSISQLVFGASSGSGLLKVPQFTCDSQEDLDEEERVRRGSRRQRSRSEGVLTKLLVKK